MSGRNFLYNLADNFIGYDDGVTTPGERFGAGANALAKSIYNDPIGLAFGIGNDLNQLMFQGGAMQRPADVLGYAAAPMAPGAVNMLKRNPNVTNAITAYHGSPHDFDKFSMDKIGTGEGAQAYGHGLYFAENEAVAKGYRDDLSQRVGATYRLPDGSTYQVSHPDVAIALDAVAKNPAAAKDWLNWSPEELASKQGPQIKEAISVIERAGGRPIEKISNANGSMYEVNINANPDDFLDWDAPLSAQSPKVRQAVTPRIEKLREHGAMLGDDPTGDMLLRVMSPQGDLDEIDFSIGPRAQGSQNALSAGIPGIKYRDAGSRGLDGETGTRNYVVFDENLINIVKKYGIAGAATALGVSASDVQAAMAQGQQQ